MSKSNFEFRDLNLNCIIPINHLISACICFNIPLLFLIVKGFTCETLCNFGITIELF